MRALTSESDFKKSTGKVTNARRFMPAPGPLWRGWETSCAFATTLPLALLRKNLEREVAYSNNLRLHGIGRLTVQAIHECKLKARKDRLPRFHAAIVGWPDPDVDKESAMERAQDLADRADLIWAMKPQVPVRPHLQGR